MPVNTYLVEAPDGVVIVDGMLTVTDAGRVGKEVKGWTSAALYAIAIPLAFVREELAQALYVVVAIMWLVPDRRIELRMQR